MKDEDVVRMIEDLLGRIENEKNQEEREDLLNMFMAFLRRLGEREKIK